MGHTVALTTSASQNEGNPAGTAAAFTFTLDRLQGDADNGLSATYTWEIRHADTQGLANLVTAANPNVPDFGLVTDTFNWAAGNITQQSFTITANADGTIEGNDSFVVWIYRGGTLIYQSSTLTLLNDDVGPPVFNTPTALTADENGTAVATISATGGGTVTYAINGGADAALFSLTNGVLTFVGPHDFEDGTPDDANGDNVFVVTVDATASGVTSSRTFNVTLTNVNEAITVTNGATANVAENSTFVATGTKTDLDAGDTATWSISGGADAAKFTIDPNSGVLSFVTAPNFEVKTDANNDGVYDVQIRATDAGGLSDTQDIAVTVTNQPDPSVITSNGGAAFVVMHVSENFTGTLLTVTATDDDLDAITFPALGGADAARFSISAGGLLTFNASPDYEVPLDAGADNTFEVIVTATSAGGADTQQIFVIVDNVAEPGDPAPPSGGGGGGGGVPNPGTGTTGPDNLVGTNGNDSQAGGDGNDTVIGGAGDDWIDGDNGADQLVGGDGNDFIRGLNDDDQVFGGDGNDDVNGNLGADFVDGGLGADTVRGGQGNDLVYGGDGDDGHVNGNIGDDQVFGGAGADTVYGGQNNDTLYGEDGNDRLSGDLGNDILYGGAGADRFTIAANGGFDWVADFSFAAGDRVLLATGTTYTMVSNGGQVSIVLSDGSSLGLAGTSTASFSSDWVVFG